MSKYVVAATDNGLMFTRETKDGKLTIVQGDFGFVAPVDSPEKGVEILKHEVSQRGNVTRAALSALVVIFNSQRMDGYKGQGDINSEGGIPKEAKTALRDAESAYFAPLFKETKKLDTFLTGIRDAGIYATVKGVALKYFFFMGRLPCHYVGDKPDTSKLLSVSAMQKLLQNALEEKEQKDESMAARVGTLFSEFCEKRDDFDVEALTNLASRLALFAEEVKQAKNTLTAKAIDAEAKAITGEAAQIMVSASEKQLLADINAAWPEYATV